MDNNHNEEIKNLQSLLANLHDAILGTLGGRQGILNSVRELEAKLVIIEQKLKENDKTAEIKEIKEQVTESITLTQSLKQEIKEVRDTVQEMKPEISDTRNKKFIISGIIIAITFLIGFLKFWSAIILPWIKGKP